MINVAVIGAGSWGMNLIRNVAQCGSTELVAVCDPNEAARRAVAARYRHTMTFAEVGSTFQVADLDAVIVATPPAMHHAHARAALENGFDVLVEKPLCTNSEDAADLVQLADATERVLMTGHTFVYNNLVGEVKNRIDSGELGDVRYVYSQRLNLGRIRNDVDAIWNLAPHDVSIANYWLDAVPTHVNVRAASFIHPQKDLADVGFFQLDYPGGRLVSGHVSWLDPQKVRRAVVVGSEKMLVYDDMNTAMHIQIYDKCVETDFQSVATDFSDFTGRLRAGDLIVPNVRLKEPLHAEIEHFADCVANRRTPITDGRSGLELVCVLEAMTASMNSRGSCVPVAYAAQNNVEQPIPAKPAHVR